MHDWIPISPSHRTLQQNPRLCAGEQARACAHRGSVYLIDRPATPSKKKTGGRRGRRNRQKNRAASRGKLETRWSLQAPQFLQVVCPSVRRISCPHPRAHPPHPALAYTYSPHTRHTPAAQRCCGWLRRMSKQPCKGCHHNTDGRQKCAPVLLRPLAVGQCRDQSRSLAAARPWDHTAATQQQQRLSPSCMAPEPPLAGCWPSAQFRLGSRLPLLPRRTLPQTLVGERVAMGGSDHLPRGLSLPLFMSASPPTKY